MSKSRLIIIFALIVFLYLDSTIADDAASADSTRTADSTQAAETPAAPDSSTMNLPQKPDSAYIARASDPGWWKRKIENKAFNVGEYLKFKVRYGIIPAGTAIIQVADTIRHNGMKSFVVSSAAHSNAFVSTFYAVRDTVISYIDYDGIFSHYFRKRLQEGNYRAEKVTMFDQKRHLAITGEDTVRTYAFVQDAFSALYYARTQDIQPGADLYIDNHTDKKNFPLKVIVHGRETVEVAAGKFDCIIVEPVMRAEGIFKAKGSIKIWLSDDRYKIPVKMQTEVFFLGSIHADLVEYRLGNFPDESERIADEQKEKSGSY